MKGEREQLSFKLRPAEPLALSYFVTHTGVAEGLQALEQSVQSVVEDPTRFVFLYLCGPSGTGKTHLMEGFKAWALERGLEPEKYVSIVLPQQALDDDETARFIATYERMRTHGGVLICSSRVSPLAATENPHVRSRLLAGQVVELGYPREEELRPLLLSLLERHNLKLAERNLQYLLKHLPADLLSFDNIFGKISELSLSRGKPAKQQIVRDVVSRIRAS